MDLLQELNESARGHRGEQRVEALLEPHHRLGPEAQTGCGPADGHGVEGRRLEDHGLRVVVDLARGTAHDTGQGDRMGDVGDDEIVRAQDSGDLVEGRHGLAVSGPADHDPGTLELADVERVQGLSQLQHHVVGEVDEGGDRPDADRLQPPADPVRARAGSNVLDDHGGVAGAELSVAHDQG